MKIGDRVFIHGYVDEIRKETVIIRNKGGYFGTDKSEVIVSAKDMEPVVRCKDCRHWQSNTEFCGIWSFQNIAQRTLNHDYCSRGERREESEAEE